MALVGGMVSFYRAFGLNISSELTLPELLPLNACNEQIDLHIQWGAVDAKGLDCAVVTHAFFQAKKDYLWLNVKDVARFLIVEGQHITIEPYAHADIASIRLFLLGSCMGALLMQRDLFLLHGNAVRVGETCVSFVGNSGAGKSTLSAAFFKRGYSILADDVCAIDQEMSVLPGFPQVKLWADAMHQLALQSHALRRVRPDVDKFAFPLMNQFSCAALPIRIVYCLNTNATDFALEPLFGVNKVKILHQHTYRRYYLKGLMKAPEYYQRSAQIANQISVVQLSRPKEGFQLESLVDFIENDFRVRGLLL